MDDLKIDLDVFKEPEVEIAFGSETKKHSVFALNRKVRPLMEALGRAAEANDSKGEYEAWDAVKAVLGFPAMGDGQAKSAVDQLSAYVARIFDRPNG